jgi:hypothetical protein
VCARNQNVDQVEEFKHVHGDDEIWDQGIETDAVGFLLSGQKLIWTHDPDYGPNDYRHKGDPDFYGFLRTHYSDDAYARTLLHGHGVPLTFGQTNGMRAPTVREWQALREDFHVPTCVHVLEAGDAYMIRRGCFHMVINQPGTTCSVTADALFEWQTHKLANRKL